MSSRQEQKERRKREREERLKREKQAEQRKKLGQIVGGVAIMAAIAVGILLAASGSGGGGGGTGASNEEAPKPLSIPETRVTNLTRAVELAKCAYTDEFPDEGSTHVEDELTPAAYKTNPPTSGNHNPVWSEDGYYPRGQEPLLKNSVHALEHGRIVYQYSKRLSANDERKLQALYNEDVSGAGEHYKTLLFQSNSNMPYLVAAVAWRSSVRCNVINQYTWDAFRAFYREKIDQGPEQVP